MINETQVAEAAHHMVDVAGERAQQCVDGGVQAMNAVTAKARAVARDADSCVRASPWIAIGAAAGVGLLAGLLLARRRS